MGSQRGEQKLMTWAFQVCSVSSEICNTVVRDPSLVLLWCESCTSCFMSVSRYISNESIWGRVKWAVLLLFQDQCSRGKEGTWYYDSCGPYVMRCMKSSLVSFSVRDKISCVIVLLVGWLEYHFSWMQVDTLPQSQVFVIHECIYCACKVVVKLRRDLHGSNV